MDILRPGYSGYKGIADPADQQRGTGKGIRSGLAETNLMTPYPLLPNEVKGGRNVGCIVCRTDIGEGVLGIIMIRQNVVFRCVTAPEPG